MKKKKRGKNNQDSSSYLVIGLKDQKKGKQNGYVIAQRDKKTKELRILDKKESQRSLQNTRINKFKHTSAFHAHQLTKGKIARKVKTSRVSQGEDTLISNYNMPRQIESDSKPKIKKAPKKSFPRSPTKISKSFSKQKEFQKLKPEP